MAHYVEPAFAAQKARLSAAPRRGEHESAERASPPLRDGNLGPTVLDGLAMRGREK